MIYERIRPPAMTYFLRPTLAKETAAGILKYEHAVKVEFKPNEYDELTFDSEKYAKEKALEKQRASQLPMSEKAFQREVKEFLGVLDAQIQNLDDFRSGFIREYIPYHVKEKQKLAAEVKQRYGIDLEEVTESEQKDEPDVADDGQFDAPEETTDTPTETALDVLDQVNA